MALLPPGQTFLNHSRVILAAVDRAVDAARTSPGEHNDRPAKP